MTPREGKMLPKHSFTPRNRRPLVSFLLALAMLLLVPATAIAQEGGWSENFEGGGLEGWELGPDVAIADGALLIGPGNFAARVGEFADFHITFKLRRDSEGAFRLGFYARDESEYALVLFPGETFIERRQNGPAIPLANSGPQAPGADGWQNIELTAAGGQFTLVVDGDQVFDVRDETPLRPGAIVFINIGGSEIAIDDVAFLPQVAQAGEAGAVPPQEIPEEAPPPEGAEPAGGEAPAGAALAPATPTPTPAATGFTALIQSLTASRADPLQLTTIVINLALSALFAFALGLAYVNWGMSLSNRRALAANFMLITVTTTFIIMIVRSSVALSLGLVGALSIVRFRAAIKEPEELAYLFFAIGLGIGLGDNQRILTLLTLLLALLLIGLGRLFRRASGDVNLHLIVSSGGSARLDLDAVLAALKNHTRRLRLQRFDENGERMEASFLVEFDSLDGMQAAREQLRGMSPGVEITFLDNRGIV